MRRWKPCPGQDVGLASALLLACGSGPATSASPGDGGGVGSPVGFHGERRGRPDARKRRVLRLSPPGGQPGDWGGGVDGGGDGLRRQPEAARRRVGIGAYQCVP